MPNYRDTLLLSDGLFSIIELVIIAIIEIIHIVILCSL